MSPLELKNMKEWKAILEAVSDNINMAASLTDKNGTILETNGDRCPLCHIIRMKKESLTYICSQCSRAMLTEVKQELKPVIDSCDAGFSRLAVPIIFHNNVIGQITACGGVQNINEIDSFLIAKQTDISEKEVENLAAATPVIAREEIQAIAERINSTLN